MGTDASAVDARFVLDDFEPAYLALERTGELAERAVAAHAELAKCRACPRNCDIDRLADEIGVCHVGRHAVVASAFPHFGEEDCLRGWAGSGTIFFGGCNLRCVFCQNWDISQHPAGAETNEDLLADLMLRLQRRNCHNINLVTPEHVVPQVIMAIAIAAEHGLQVPIVYNTSAYDAHRSLELLDGIVDVYMPDFKFWHAATARRLARAADYPDRARETILEMHRQVGPLRFGPDGLARRGVLVRHLVMPGQEDETAAIVRWLADEVSPDTYVNLMDQYRPEHRVPGAARYADIDRRPLPEELVAAREAARDAGIWRLDARH